MNEIIASDRVQANRSVDRYLTLFRFGNEMWTPLSGSHASIDEARQQINASTSDPNCGITAWRIVLVKNLPVHITPGEA